MIQLLVVVASGATLAAATALAGALPSRGADHRLLRHLVSSGTAPRRSTRTRNLVTRTLTLAGAELGPAALVARISALASAAGTLTLAAGVAVHPSLDTLLIAGAVTLAAALGAFGLVHAAERTIARDLMNDLVLVMTELDGALQAGMPLTRALTTLGHESESAWKVPLRYLATRIAQGRTTSEALWELADLLPNAALREPILLLAQAERHHATAQVLPAIIAAASRRQHASLVATASRIEQLVWIPVAVATLIPGLLLVMVPLIGSLGALLKT